MMLLVLRNRWRKTSRNYNSDLKDGSASCTDALNGMCYRTNFLFYFILWRHRCILLSSYIVFFLKNEVTEPITFSNLSEITQYNSILNWRTLVSILILLKTYRGTTILLSSKYVLQFIRRLMWEFGWIFDELY